MDRVSSHAMRMSRGATAMCSVAGSIEMTTQSASLPGSRRGIVLALGVGAALLLRTWWAWTHGLAIENEGAEYARIGMNLFEGRGYVGMLNNGTQLNFPPLYPISIAVVSLVTGDAEIAARAINVVLAALLVIPMFSIAEQVYGWRAAVAVAALVVLHPVLIAAGASTYAEGPYLTLTAFATMYLVRWMEHRRVVQAIAAGTFLGLAYLVRPEAFLTVGMFVAGGLMMALVRRERRTALIATLSLIAAFAVVAAPNVVFLTATTGQFRLQAKGTLSYYWGERMNRGMSYMESALGIGPELQEVGVFMRPNLEVMQSTSYSASEFVSFIATAARRNLRPIARTLTAESDVGSPWLFVLVAIGLFRTAWDRRRLALEAILLGVATLSVAVLLAIQELWFRYYLVAFGFLLLWAGKGATELASWGRDTSLRVTGSARFANGVGTLCAAMAMLLVFASATRALPSNFQFAESHNREHRQAGLWLAQQRPSPTWIMDVGVQVGFYAGAHVAYLPFAEADVALRYIEKRRPDYIVLLGGQLGSLPYTKKWFQEGIPDDRAVLVYDEGSAAYYDTGTSSTERIKIYHWVDRTASQ
jgi:4-amino-4-deoxy-L-arabinose transferase-like glycosyltransferase